AAALPTEVVTLASLSRRATRWPPIHATDRNEWVLPAHGQARQDPSIEERAVKRTVTYAAGVLILGGAVYAGSRRWAQKTCGAARPAPTTRIALINLPYVIKNYEKYKSFIKQMQEEEKGYANDIKTKKDQQEAKNKQLQSTVDAAQKEKLET